MSTSSRSSWMTQRTSTTSSSSCSAPSPSSPDMQPQFICCGPTRRGNCSECNVLFRPHLYFFLPCGSNSDQSMNLDANAIPASFRLSNDKASAIFRLKAVRPPNTGSTGHSNDMTMEGDSPGSRSTPITATLGISMEPIDVVISQISSMSSTSTSSTTTSSMSSIPSNALIPLSAASTSSSPDSVVAMAQKVMSHLYNHVTSFATAVLPPGSTVLVPTGGPGSSMNVLAGGAQATDSSYLPVKAFNDWFQNVVRKAKADPLFLSRD